MVYVLIYFNREYSSTGVYDPDFRVHWVPKDLKSEKIQITNRITDALGLVVLLLLSGATCWFRV